MSTIFMQCAERVRPSQPGMGRGGMGRGGMVRTLTKTLAERRREHRAGKRHETLDWLTGRLHVYRTGEMPQPGDLPNAQGVFIIRKGRTVRLHDILAEDWKKDFDPDDTIEDPATSEPLTRWHDGSTTVPGLTGVVDENQERVKSQKAEKAQKKVAQSNRRASAAARSEESSKQSSYQRAINKAILAVQPSRHPCLSPGIR